MSSGTSENPNGGHWHGHFEKDGKQTPQLIVLYFEGGKLKDDGKSADEIGAYTISGGYTPPAKNDTAMKWTKSYVGKHEVQYEGTLKKADAKNKDKDPAWQIVGVWKKHTPAVPAGASGTGSPAIPALTESGSFVLNAPVHQDPNGGLWQGWFAYPDHKQISIVQAMHFKAGQIFCDGKAADPIGAYTVSGSYTPPAKVGTQVQWTKQYTGKHLVKYTGAIQLGANKKWVIRGVWQRPDITNGPNTGAFELSSP